MGNRNRKKQLSICITFIVLFSLLTIFNTAEFVVSQTNIIQEKSNFKNIKFQTNTFDDFELLDNWSDNNGSIEVFVYNTYVYLTGKFGVYGFDILNATDPKNLEFIGDWGKEEKYYVRSLIVQNDIVYILQGYNLTLIDVTNPCNPIKISTIKPQYYAAVDVAAIEVKDKIVYLLYHFWAFTNLVGIGLITINCSNPRTPIILDTYDLIIAEAPFYPDNNWEIKSTQIDLELNNNYAFCTWHYVFRVFDIKNASDISKLDSYYCPYYPNSGDIDITDDIAFVSYNDFGVRIYDISDVTYISLIANATANDPNNSSETVFPWAISIDNDVLYMACGPNGLRAANIADINNPVFIGTYSAENCTVTDVFAFGNVVFISDFWRSLDVVKLRYLDIIWPPNSIPSKPNTIGFYIIITIILPFLYILAKKYNRKN